MRTRLALVCLVWGDEFAGFFARYCIPSLLEPQNIPRIARELDVTLLLYTDRATLNVLDGCESFRSLSRLVEVEVLPLEDLPATARTNHWVPWQQAVAGRNRDFDLFLVVIPDCVYSAGCLGTIIAALDEHDTVYYTLPQVCRETVAAELEGLRRVDGHAYISFTALQAVELFIRHVNPKHAAAAVPGTFFISHPEFAIQLSPTSMVVSETGSHPFAVKASTRSVSYTLDALSSGARTCYLEILGVSAEPALKFVEEYYRWPTLFRDHSRLMNLGTWAWNFRDASNRAYSRSAIHIALDRGRALEQHRGPVKRAKTKFTNATLDFLAVGMRIHGRAREMPDPTVARYVALVLTAPGLHRQLRRLQSGCTVVLPVLAGRFAEVVRRIETRPAATALLRRFLFLHVVPHHLPILPGHAIFLAYSDAADDFPKAFVIDPHTIALGAGLRGRVLSPPQWVWDNAFCIQADLDYSDLTWSMLDPRNGTAERVLDHPTMTGAVGEVEKLHNGASVDASNDVPHADCSCPRIDGDSGSARLDNLQVVSEEPPRGAGNTHNVAKLVLSRGYHRAVKLPLLAQPAWLMRNLYRKGNGKPWLSLADAGIDRPVLRLARRQVRVADAVAGEAPPGPRPAAPEPPASHPLPPGDGGHTGYDAIARLNIVDNVAKVTRAFYERLGLEPRQSPVYECLVNLCSKLAHEVEVHGGGPAASALEGFERGWRAWEAGRSDEALELFGAVLGDTQLANASAADPRAREAIVRAAEILARHAELRGDGGAAAQLYHRILELDGNGIIARRLLVLLWREGRLREAAELAPRILQSDGNLAQYLRGSEAVKDLTRRLGGEARRQATTARGQDA